MALKRVNGGPNAIPAGPAAGWRAGWFWLGLALSALTAAARAPAPAPAPRTIVFFGDSITAGYGLDSPDDAYPAVIRRKIDRAGLAWRVVNAGLSGETTAGGLRRIDWVLRQPVDLFVLELGGNDGLRGIPVADARANLQAMIDRIRAKYPQAAIVLAGMQLPANLGPDYTGPFAAMYPELARLNHTALIPFLLEGVGGVPSLNQADGIHPNLQGHCLVAENVWRVIKTML